MEEEKKRTVIGLKQLRRPIPFHGGGAVVEDDLLLLPGGFWTTNLKLCLYEPVETFNVLFSRLLDDEPRGKITCKMFDEFVGRTIGKSVKFTVKSVHRIIFAHFNAESVKHPAGSRWYEAYLTAFYLSMLIDLSLEIGNLSSTGNSEDLFHDEEANEVIVSKEVVVYNVEQVCNKFKKTYKLIDEGATTKDNERLL